MNLDEALAPELADCLWSIITLADMYEVNLTMAFDRTMDMLTDRLTNKGDSA